MSAERIQAAITALEALRNERWYFESSGWIAQNLNAACTCAGFDQFGHPAHEAGCGSEPITNDELFVTLHRTIDAQLVLLKAGRSACTFFPHVKDDADLPGWAAEAKAHALAFADAILGGSDA
jgi:hypothetical protein